jgi:hypothetical protein
VVQNPSVVQSPAEAIGVMERADILPSILVLSPFWAKVCDGPGLAGLVIRVAEDQPPHVRAALPYEERWALLPARLSDPALLTF